MTLQLIPKSKLWLSIAGASVAIAVVVLVAFGLKQGIDFTGGTLLELRFQETVASDQIVQTLNSLKTPGVKELTEEEVGVESSGAPTRSALDMVDIGDPKIQATGENSFLIRLKYINNYTHNQILAKLATINADQPVVELRYENIGPTVGATLRKNALMAVLIASIFMILYISFAFRKMPKAIGAWKCGLVTVIAMLHDVVVTCGVFAILGVVLNVEIDSLFITALLTIIGYSVHDTIVVMDRIRENMFLSGRAVDFPRIANDSVNQTMARSINTSLTTLIVLLALFFFGGTTIHYFVLTLILGIIFGTYSSIFIAAPLLVIWRKK